MVWVLWWLRRRLRVPLFVICLPAYFVADAVYWRLLFNTRVGRLIDTTQVWWRRRRWPRTVDEAVKRLYRRLSPSERRLLAGPEDEIDWFCFGMDVRYEFGLWDGNQSLIDSCNLGPHIGPAADHASEVIIDQLVKLVRIKAATNRAMIRPA